MNDYDIEGAFNRIEKELINSMIGNFKGHKAWEKDEGFNWEMWQAKQLKSLQQYRQRNKKKFKSYFQDINENIDEMLNTTYKQGGLEQEAKILEAIKRGYHPPRRPKETIIEGNFFKVNDRKLNSLIKATKQDFSKAEIAMLRQSNDVYRKIIFDSQVYFNTGAATYEKAVDMATKDFLSKGINCIEYKNGARVNIVDYVAMAIQTANKRAYLQGEGSKRQEWGISTVLVASRGGGCPRCVPFQGRVFIDDVWSGGSSEDGDYPLLSSAIAAGLFHPNCKDICTTYFEGITSEPTLPTKSEKSKMLELYTLGQKIKYAKRMTRKYDNLQQGSLDSDNKAKYKNKKLQWKEYVTRLRQTNLSEQGDILDRIKSTFNSSLSKQIKSFNRELSNSKNRKVVYLFSESLKRTSIVRSKNNKSFHKNGKIYLSKSARGSTIAHELFHEIDRHYGITKNNAITDSIIYDYNNIQQMADFNGKSIKDMLYCNYPNAFVIINGKIKIKEEYRGISDIINGMTKGKTKLGYGHKDDYWEKPKALEKETWAQFGRIIFDGNINVLTMAKELFPTINSTVNNIIKGVSDNVLW